MSTALLASRPRLRMSNGRRLDGRLQRSAVALVANNVYSPCCVAAIMLLPQRVAMQDVTVGYG